jgi:hypothetical protein
VQFLSETITAVALAAQVTRRGAEATTN